MLFKCTKCKELKSEDNFYYYSNGERRVHCKSCHYRRNYQLKWKYGMTVEQYNELLIKQGGHCFLCNETEGLEVDHDHSCCKKRPTCGKCTRGLLCDRHNRAIGFFTKEELDKAVIYLTLMNGGS